MMRAVTFTEPGDANVLEMTNIPKPNPGPWDLLVKVRATALNRADILQRRGHYPPPPGSSDILGLELAGTITAMGENVKNFKLNTRVCGLVAGGAYAEYCLLDSRLAMSIPNNWDDHKAAALPEAFMTADEILFTLGELKPGERVLIHAGGSGVGSTAIMMAKYNNAEIITTAGSDEKLNRCQTLGAQTVINYKTEDFEQVLKSKKPIDLIIDFVGAEYFERHINLLNTKGRLIHVGLMRGTKASINLKQVLSKRLQLKGMILRTRSITEKQALVQRMQQRWWPALLDNKISPIIDKIFPMTEVISAHQHMENNQHFGKIILAWD